VHFFAETGSQENIEKALEMVRKKYPNVNTTHVNEILSRQAIPEGITLSTDRMQVMSFCNITKSLFSFDDGSVTKIELKFKSYHYPKTSKCLHSACNTLYVFKIDF